MDSTKPLSFIVIGCAIEVHKELGPGLLESVYEKALEYELKSKGLKVESQKSVPVMYKGAIISNDLKLDLIVNDSLIIELKSVDTLQKVHYKQLLTYLKLTNKREGLLINFNEEVLKKGIHHVLNG